MSTELGRVPEPVNVCTITMLESAGRVSFSPYQQQPLRWKVFSEGRSVNGSCNHKMPESASALWRIVSLTAAKTSRIFEVSVAWVRLWDRDI